MQPLALRLRKHSEVGQQTGVDEDTPRVDCRSGSEGCANLEAFAEGGVQLLRKRAEGATNPAHKRNEDVDTASRDEVSTKSVVTGCILLHVAQVSLCIVAFRGRHIGKLANQHVSCDTGNHLVLARNLQVVERVNPDIARGRVGLQRKGDSETQDGTVENTVGWYVVGSDCRIALHGAIGLNLDSLGGRVGGG